MDQPELVARLSSALTAVLEEAGRVWDDSHPTPQDFANWLAATDVVEQANRASEQLALHVGYGVRAEGNQRKAGRRLTAQTILEVGLANALASGDELDEAAIVCDIAAYLAGPTVNSIHLVGIDADLVLTRPLDFDGWQLTTADPDTLRSIATVPSLLAYQPQPPWDPDGWDRIAFLRRSETRPPVTGMRWAMPRVFPEWHVWRPLTVLALAQPDVVTMWCEYDVEPGRDVFERFNEVWYEYSTYGLPDDEVDVESPGWLSIGLRPDGEDDFEDRLMSISALLPREPSSGASKQAKARYARIERASQRLLAAGRNARGSATPWEPIRAMDSLLHYVVALESLLVSDSSQGEINRKIVQRAAVLAGRSDSERLSIAKLVRDIYAFRSKVMHGAADPIGPELDGLRLVVRRVLLACLVYDQMGEQCLEIRCDQALLSATARDELLDPLTPFDAAMAPLPASE